MKLRKTRVGSFNRLDKFKGQLKGVKYEITEQLDHSYYVLAHDIKKDLVFNSLWLGLKFDTVELAQAWCEKSPDIEDLRNKYFKK